MEFKELKEYGLKISRCGQVINLNTGKIIKATPDKYGYARVYTKQGDKRKGMYVHRLLAIAYIPNPENKPCINHIDANKTNFSLENLEWCTHKENTKHARVNGLWKTKPGKPEKPMRNEMVKTLYSTGKYTYENLGDAFGVSGHRIREIVLGLTKGHYRKLREQAESFA